MVIRLIESFTVSTLTLFLDGDAKHSSSSFQSLAQPFSKGEVKLASKHKVVSEELNDKVDGEPLGEKPRRSLENDLKFHGHAVKDLYFLELFAGAARLTKRFGQEGRKAMAFDKTSKRSKGQSVLEYDLSNKDKVDSFAFH